MTMENISWSLKLSVSDGHLEQFRDLMNEMVELTRAEGGCMTYDWYVMDNGSEVHIQERYANNAAAMVHIGNFGANFAERFMGLVTVRSFAVYGPASDEVRGALTTLGAVFLDHFGGFRR